MVLPPVGVESVRANSEGTNAARYNFAKAKPQPRGRPFSTMSQHAMIEPPRLIEVLLDVCKMQDLSFAWHL
jgi:hypothetical protein